jgi:hypothetical protein
MYTDSVVDEVRAVRSQHLAKFNGNVDLAFADIAQQHIKLERQGWKFVHSPLEMRQAQAVRLEMSANRGL